MAAVCSLFQTQLMVLLALLVASLWAPLGFAAEYQLADGCSLKKWVDERWQSADGEDLLGATPSDFSPLEKKIRFKIGETWYLTQKRCLERVDGEAMEEETSTEGGDSFGTAAPGHKHRFRPFLLAGSALTIDTTPDDYSESPQFAVGFGFAFRFTDSFSLKSQFSISNKFYGPTPDNPVSYSYDVTVSDISAIPTFHFGGFYFGPQLAWAKVSSKVQLGITSGATELAFSKSTFAAGANLGYLIQLSSRISLGPDFYFTHYFESKSGDLALEKIEMFKLFLVANFEL